MLCSKLHCKKGFNLILFSYKIARTPSGFAFPARPKTLGSRACGTAFRVWGCGRVLSVDGGSGGRGLVIIPRTPIPVWVPRPPENSGQSFVWKRFPAARKWWR